MSLAPHCGVIFRAILVDGSSQHGTRAATPRRSPNPLKYRLSFLTFLAIRRTMGRELGREEGGRVATQTVVGSVGSEPNSVEALLDLLPLMYFVVDEQGLIRLVNRAGVEALGYSREELVGASVFHIFFPADRSQVRHQVIECMKQSDRVSKWEFRKIRKDGSLVWVRETVRPVRNAAGEMRIHIICEDITEIREAQERLHEAQTRYRRFVENVPAISYEVELQPHPVTTFISPQVKQILGYAPEEWLEHPDFWQECMHPEDQSRVLEELAQKNETGESIAVEYRVRTRCGAWCWVRNCCEYERDHRGRPTRCNGVMLDITDARRIEQRELEVQARCARAARMESLGLLAGGVAHDLNNILAPLIGYPDLLMSELPPGSPQVEDLGIMRDSALRAMEMVQDLLALARGGTASNGAVDLNALCKEFARSPMLREAKSKRPDLRIEFDLEPQLPRVAGSSTHLVQVLMNLVLNACEAIEGTGLVKVQTRRDLVQQPVGAYGNVSAGEFVVLHVSDTGCGISATDLEHIFEPFYTRKVMGRSGSGLGLSVVYGVVKDMNGCLEIQSTPGEGSTFIIYLPVHGRAADPLRKPPPTELRGTERVLVVDDSGEQRVLMHRLLTHLGYDTATAASREEALAALQGQPFDLVLIDLDLGEAPDGVDLFLAIRAFQPTQRCVLLSGMEESERTAEALKLGIAGVLRKPCTMNSLGKMVRRALAGTPA